MQILRYKTWNRMRKAFDFFCIQKNKECNLHSLFKDSGGGDRTPDLTGMNRTL